MPIPRNYGISAKQHDIHPSIRFIPQIRADEPNSQHSHTRMNAFICDQIIVAIRIGIEVVLRFFGIINLNTQRGYVTLAFAYIFIVEIPHAASSGYSPNL
jgi:hypothetical protein